MGKTYFFKILKNFFVTLLIKVYGALLRLWFRLYYKTRFKITILLNYAIRYNNENYKRIGLDERDDNIIYCAIAPFLGIDYIDQKIDLDGQKEIRNLREEIQSKFVYLDILTFYHSWTVYFNNTDRRIKKNTKAQAQKSREIANNLNIDLDSFLKENNIDKYRKKLIGDLKYYRTEVRKRNEFTIDLKKVNYSFIFSLLSITFLTTGYLSKKFLYSYFDLKVEDYYLLTDYISSSIDLFPSSFLASISSLVGLFFYIRFLTNTDHYLNNSLAKRKKEKIRRKKEYYFILGVLIIAIVISYKSNSSEQFILYSLFGILIINDIADYIAAKYFKQSIEVLITLVFCLNFMQISIFNDLKDGFEIVNNKN